MDQKISLQALIGRQIKRSRRSIKRTQDDVAQGLNLTREKYDQIERGQYVLTSKLLADIATEVGVDVSDFFCDVTTEEKVPSITEGFDVQLEKTSIINRIQEISHVTDLRLISTFLDTFD